MTARGILAIATVVFVLAFFMDAAVAIIWMTVPARIVYQQSSPFPTDTYTVKVVEHGTSFFITPHQKRILDLIRGDASPIGLGSFGIAVIAYLVAAAAQLRIPGPPGFPCRRPS